MVKSLKFAQILRVVRREVAFQELVDDTVSRNIAQKISPKRRNSILPQQKAVLQTEP
jgi:hypothetical protein